MTLINSSLGLSAYNPNVRELYVLLHALLGGAVGLSAHMMVHRLRPGGKGS